MKLNKKVLLLPVLLAFTAMLTSCCCQSERQSSVATILPVVGSPTPQISTSLVQVTGPEGVMTFQLDEQGQCKSVWFGEWNTPENPPKNGSCGDGYALEKTMFCIPASESNPANIKTRDGKGSYHCAPILFATDGTDIRFKLNPESHNRICKYIGGYWQCYPR